MEERRSKKDRDAMPVVLGIFGATGRMGKEVVCLAKEDKDLCSYIEYKRGDDISSFLDACDVAIDFSTLSATRDLLIAAKKCKTALVIGTTGLSETTLQLMHEASSSAPIVYSSNFSIGMVAYLAATKILSDMLSTHFSLSIEETHHVHKKDSPSGTALSIAKATEKNPPILSIREGEVIGEHRLIFSSATETVELKHQALSRSTFARGAIVAAKHLYKRPSGLYSLKDLFLHL